MGWRLEADTGSLTTVYLLPFTGSYKTVPCVIICQDIYFESSFLYMIKAA